MEKMLVTDGDSHWFVIPAERKRDWDQWVDSDDIVPPEYAEECDGPQSVVFTGLRRLF